MARATATWDGESYAQNTAHHRAFDDHVLSGWQVRPDGRILDVGCGSGDLTARLAGLVPNGEVLGIDADPSMVATATRLHAGPRVRFVRCAAQHLAGIEDSSVDAVVSVAALHWLPRLDHGVALQEMARVLRPGAPLRADLGGQGQIARTRALLDDVSGLLGGPVSPWHFPSVRDYEPLLAQAGLRIDGGWLRLVRQRRSLPDLTSLLGWLRSQVLVAYESGMDAPMAQAFRRAVELRAPELMRSDASFDQDYVRLDLLAHRC